MKKPKFELDEELIKRLKQIGIYRDEDEIEGQNSSKDKVKSPPAVNSTPNGKKTYLRVSDFHWSSEIPEEFIQKTAEVCC